MADYTYDEYTPVEQQPNQGNTITPFQWKEMLAERKGTPRFSEDLKHEFTGVKIIEKV